MKQKYLIRRSHDKGQLYCMAERGTRDEIVCLKLTSDGVIKVEPIFESSTSHLLAL